MPSLIQMGVIFPQTEIGDDSDIVSHLAMTAESLGYRHLRLADGWLPMDLSTLREDLAHVLQIAREHDRNPDEIGIDCVIPPSKNATQAGDKLKSLEDFGVTHATVSMMNLGLVSSEAHADSLKEYRDAVGALAHQRTNGTLTWP